MNFAFRKLIVELSPSNIFGVGVFAASSMRKDERIAEGIHQSDYRRLIPWENLKWFNPAIKKKINMFCIGTPDGFIPPDDLDFNRLSIEWYLNHSCDGNVGFNEDGDFVARRRVSKSEELTYDYGLAESNPRFRMVCACGSSDCRRVITGNDWKDPAFRKQNLNYMLPRLRQATDARTARSARPLRVAARHH